ncbi:MAG TPA: LLM class flavin-dependent oxidoreductase [Candidatus Limnocylindrales bacterium]|nr:LLM class flavin-dependent oxidoreductase [Candidatus Limnocylindrales bacterium]
MKFGVSFASRVGDHHLVKLAEDLGFDEAWFYDSQMIYSDVYATMALAADRTSRIRLGTGVAVVSTRMAPVIAHSIATIAQLAPGRVDLGIGTGNTARYTMALPPVPLSRLKNDVRVIRRLLDGETADMEAEGRNVRVRFLHREGGYLNLRERIPIILSAMAPRILEFCASECDGHMIWGISPPLLATVRPAIEAVAARSGRAPVPTVAFMPTVVLEAGETKASPRVLRVLASFITNWLHVQCEWGDRAPLAGTGDVAEIVAEYKAYVATLPPDERHLTLHRGHLLFAREDEKRFVRPELVDKTAIAAEPDAIIDYVRALERGGLQQYVIPINEDPEREMRRFAETVMQRY